MPSCNQRPPAGAGYRLPRPLHGLAPACELADLLNRFAAISARRIDHITPQAVAALGSDSRSGFPRPADGGGCCPRWSVTAAMLWLLTPDGQQS